jgi:hypothetical protein
VACVAGACVELVLGWVVGLGCVEFVTGRLVGLCIIHECMADRMMRGPVIREPFECPTTRKVAQNTLRD